MLHRITRMKSIYQCVLAKALQQCYDLETDLCVLILCVSALCVQENMYMCSNRLYIII